MTNNKKTDETKVVIQLPIMEDELALGYSGRLARVNAWNYSALATRRLRQWAQINQSVSAEITRVEALAIAANVPFTQFVRTHTMLPLNRSVAITDVDIPHGSSRKRTLLRRAFAQTRDFQYSCAVCAGEDLNTYGFSWWRRIHQLPGLLWCPEHKTGLSAVICPEPFSLQPHECDLLDSQIAENQWVRAIQNPFVLRYLEILNGFLGSTKPVASADVSSFARTRIYQHLSISDCCHGPLSAEALLLEGFDRDWFASVLSLGTKTLKMALKVMTDSLNSSSLGVTAIGYALLLAIVYENAEVALIEVAKLTVQAIHLLKSKYLPVLFKHFPGLTTEANAWTYGINQSKFLVAPLL